MSPNCASSPTSESPWYNIQSRSSSPRPAPTTPLEDADPLLDCTPSPEFHISDSHVGKRHARFYLPDGNVIFRVENTLYCVHRYFFQKYSEGFAAKYKLCEETEATFIHLEDVQAKDFDQMLSIFYPSTWSTIHPDTKTVDEWTSVLRLATTWNFTSLRKLAVDRLSKITSPIEKILLSYRFDIPQWLPLAYASLCERSKPLSIEEGRQLFELGGIGGDIIILLNQARHELTRNPGNTVATPPPTFSRSTTVASKPVVNANEVVKKVFGFDEGEPKLVPAQVPAAT